MNKKKKDLFYTRYLQKQIYFRTNDVVNALFNLEKYLFENFNESTFAQIERNILRQARVYMPAIIIDEIFFSAPDENANALSIQIKYSIPNLNTKDLLEFTI